MSVSNIAWLVPYAATVFVTIVVMVAFMTVVKLAFGETFAGAIHGLIKECIGFLRGDNIVGTINFVSFVVFCLSCYFLIYGDILHEFEEILNSRPEYDNNARLAAASFAIFMLFLTIVISLAMVRIDRANRRPRK